MNREKQSKNNSYQDENNVKLIIFFVEVKNSYRQVKGNLLARIYIIFTFAVSLEHDSNPLMS